MSLGRVGPRPLAAAGAGGGQAPADRSPPVALVGAGRRRGQCRQHDVYGRLAQGDRPGGGDPAGPTGDPRGPVGRRAGGQRRASQSRLAGRARGPGDGVARCARRVDRDRQRGSPPRRGLGRRPLSGDRLPRRQGPPERRRQGDRLPRRAGGGETGLWGEDGRGEDDPGGGGRLPCDGAADARAEGGRHPRLHGPVAAAGRRRFSGEQEGRLPGRGDRRADQALAGRRPSPLGVPLLAEPLRGARQDGAVAVGALAAGSAGRGRQSLRGRRPRRPAPTASSRPRCRRKRPRIG